jgi:hypothetical protein
MQEEGAAKNKKALWLKVAAVLFALAFALGIFLWQMPREKDTSTRFTLEVYDIIVENYWQKVDEAKLAELFRLSLAQASGNSLVTLSSTDRKGVMKMMDKVVGQVAEDKMKAIAIDTSIIVLNALAPQGRSGLLSEKEETEFRDNVGNINPDTGEVDPTVESRLIGKTLYLDIEKIAPTTIIEIANAVAAIEGVSEFDSMIIDLRGNVGGALDFARYFYALFAGANQYAYDLFQQGELNPERTPAIAKVAALDNVKDVAILTDSTTQSTAELLASIFKRFNLGKVVGERTKGWGTVENTFPIKTTFEKGEKFSVLLVHSLTVREDGEAIEENGVLPHVDIGKNGWEKDLDTHFVSQVFIRDLTQIVGN